MHLTLQQLGEAEHRVQRRAQLVADHGQELRFGDAGRLGLGPRGCQGLGEVALLELQRQRPAQHLVQAARGRQEHQQVDQAHGAHGEIGHAALAALVEQPADDRRQRGQQEGAEGRHVGREGGDGAGRHAAQDEDQEALQGDRALGEHHQAGQAPEQAGPQSDDGKAPPQAGRRLRRDGLAPVPQPDGGPDARRRPDRPEPSAQEAGRRGAHQQNEDQDRVHQRDRHRQGLLADQGLDPSGGDPAFQIRFAVRGLPLHALGPSFQDSAPGRSGGPPRCLRGVTGGA